MMFSKGSTYVWHACIATGGYKDIHPLLSVASGRMLKEGGQVVSGSGETVSIWVSMIHLPLIVMHSSEYNNHGKALHWDVNNSSTQV